jgi:flagellin-like protein
MTLRERLFDDSSDRGVSPVIGVILMVAITVILATVIGAIVLDFGNNAGETAPSASLSVEADSPNEVTIEHTGGDSLSLDQTRIQLTKESDGSTREFSGGSANFGVGDIGTLETDGSAQSGDLSTLGSGSEDSFTIASGDQVTVTVIDTDSQRQIYKTTVSVQ